ncbi:class F sortase [Streptomyces violaceorubidus]
MRRVKNTAIAAVTAVALCSGGWLLIGGARPDAPPQPSAAQARHTPTGPGGPCGAPTGP